MKRILLCAAIVILSAAGTAGGEGFTLKSDDFQGQLSIAQVFNGFGCKGKNVSPSLKWSGFPKGTKSFAVTMYDPDAPTGSGWWHWVVFNIPADVNELKTGAGEIEKNLSPRGSVQSITDYGKPGFGGACPPVGDRPHRYIVTVYALDAPKLDLDEKTPPAMVGFFLNGHALAKASIIAYYGRR